MTSPPAVIQTPSLQAKYLASGETVFMTGVQALVRLPLDQHRADLAAGRRTAAFISGYEGSPLGTYDLELGRQRKLLDEHGVVFQPGVNEELAATSVMGTQLVDSVGRATTDGVVGLWYGKTPGLDRAGDALRHANVIGTLPTGGAVAFVGDDPTAKSSTLPGASESALAALEIPTLYPGDGQEVLDLGLHAIAMSRSSGLWSALKIVTNVADGSGTVAVADARVAPIMTQPERNGVPSPHRPSAMLIGAALQELERSLRYERMDAARRYIALNGLNRITQRGPRDEVGIVAAGKSYFDLRDALGRLGLDDAALADVGVRLLKVSAPYPLDPTLVDEFAADLREIVIVEEKRAFLEIAVKDALYHSADRPRVVGKQDELGAPLFSANGELGPDVIARLLGQRLLGLERTPRPLLEERLAELAPPRPLEQLPVARTPYFCSGCPHNTSTKVPDGTVVGGGIGCSGLVMSMHREQVGDVVGVTQMGGEGAQFIGVAPFTEIGHFTQNLGDGTYSHSGSLAVRAAVASGVNVTYKILFNSAVAMTGGQQPVGALTVGRLAQQLLLEGVGRVIVTTDDVAARRPDLPRDVEVWDRSRSIEAQEVLSTVPGVTALIHDQECAAEKRRKRKRGKAVDPARRIFINERVCEGCGDCGEKSNCLSVEPVETEFGRKTRIDQSSCNKDYTCVNGDCPSFLEVLPAKRPEKTKAAAALDAADLPSPTTATARSDVAMRLTGVGGTGIVTVAQILAMAAGFDGWHVRGLDQTGMAQKGGPVVSDLRLSREPGEAANKLAADDCDLYLGCDVLVAADGANLSVADPQRTVAVVSDATVPTGAMVRDTSVAFPPLESLTDRIAARVRPDGLHLIDARAVAQKLLGSGQVANMVLVGAAFQAGALPVDAAAIESAIELNGAAVATNIQAFRRGRQAIVDPGALAEAMKAGAPKRPRPQPTRGQQAAGDLVERVQTSPGSELRRLLEIRVPDLVDYQNTRYAHRYVEWVERVRDAEAAVTAGQETLAEAVAHNLHKLMAYKDEAEVARLSLDPQLTDELEAQFGVGARYAYKLHPPVLRALGRKTKISLGPWFRPGFRALYAMRHLRGTRLDPFGFTEVRRTERELIREYQTVLEELTAGLTADNHAAAVEIASLPDLVRGYEDIKLRNVATYRQRLTGLRDAFAA